MHRATAAIVRENEPWDFPFVSQTGAHASPPEMWRILGQAHDILGIDRRSVRRSRQAATSLPSTGLWHESMQTLVGLQCQAGWALAEAFVLAPRGLLVRAIQPLTPGSTPQKRAILAAMASRSPSALAWVGTCVLSQPMIRSLARAANPESGSSPRLSPVTLIVPSRTDPSRMVEIEGCTTPLTDPHPKTLAIALSEQGHRQWVEEVRGVGTPNAEHRVKAIRSNRCNSGTASVQCLEHHE